MVLKPEPFFASVESVQCQPGSPVLLMTPQGTPFKQRLASQLAEQPDIVIICGHYEGFDERIRTLATHEISIGDYVLTGGELPSLVIIDAICRLIPGVLGKSASLVHESFEDSLLEGPQYTKPAEFRGIKVPEILLSGDHQAIATWRREQALKRTFDKRQDLLNKAPLSQEEQEYIKHLHIQRSKKQIDL